ncbi:Fur family transcriptional regulator [Peptostreptococcus faecalis]|uniref:Fur family transcriptional regulator n=1 Tax=Peptostreptococcus faecalis TaxID=2045015 RepID=UPI000C7CFD32|nr:transcriptional repressor [Peptostreptococcus faecalis]
MKFSKQREFILNRVLQSNEHHTATEIYDSLKKDNPSLSLGTVYRNLTQLADNGYIRKINIQGDPARFDANLEEHNHFICEQCNDIIDVDLDDVSYVDNTLEKNGMKIKSGYILLKGLCKNCNTNK